MSQRYKIISQKVGIKITHYELWLEYQILWFFKRWHPVCEQEFHMDGHSKQVPRKFRDLNDVREYLHPKFEQIERTVVEEGMVE